MRSCNRRDASLQFESLEERRMLSGTPPTIEEILIGGQAWRDAFVAKLVADGEGNGGFRLTLQNSAQPLPWSNLDRLTLRFNEGVDVQESDLYIQGVQTGLAIPLAAGGFTYDSTKHTATWTFAQPLGADKYAIRLVDRVANGMDLALDGEGAPRTGDGTPGGDFVFQFSVVPGDGNQNGVTNMHDGLGVRERMFADTNRPDYLTRYDFDGSGVINIQDGLEFRDKLFDEIPAGTFDFDGPLLVAELQRDTAAAGLTNFDSVTFDATITGIVVDPLGGNTLVARVDGGAAVPVALTPEGSFEFHPALAVDGSADGVHRVEFIARDGFGNASRFEVEFTLDTQAPVLPPLRLSAGSGFVSPQTSSAGRVTLLGAATPGLTVSLVGSGMSALVNNAGEFMFPAVPLVVGDNLFTATATDAAGNTVQVPTLIRRVEIAAQQDPVLRWNQMLLDAVQFDASAPTFASRAMAMVHAAIYDAVSAIEGTAGYSVSLAAPTGISLEAAVSGAAHRVLSYLYPAQQAIFNTVRTAALGQVPDGAAETGGVTFGQLVGEAIIALRADDGWDDFVDYVPGTNPGDWQQTEPLYAPALDPQWGNLASFSGADLDELTPSGPPSLSSLQWANALNEVKSLGSASSTVRTADQTQIARFWADGSGTYSPPGHWNKIAQQVAVAAGNSIAENARLFAKLDIALADAAILAWKAKFETDFWRPFTAIHNAADDGNDLTTADATWQPLLITPNFPEYVSGHSTFSGAAAAVLTSIFGANYSFTTTSSGLLGVNRTFTSFDAAATEAGRSRIYGGIHYEFSNQDGQAAGRALAAQVLSTFDASADVVAPKILLETDSGGVTATNQNIVGRVIDNLSGVATLTASVDGGAVAPVVFDALGRFTFTTSLALNGVAEGAHTISLSATDFQGNVSDPQLFSFTLDTLAPTVQIIAPEEGATLEVGSLLSGLANATGSSIVELKYAFAGQPARTIPFDSATGEFSVPLNIAALAPGATVLTVSIRDAAGHASSVIRNLTVAQRAAFGVERFTPLNGARDVGSTYHPQVFFSRAVNPTSLNANNFYATGPNGAKLAANIVPAGDGSFAWLFFTQPMPSASQITVHVNGATILAAADGAQLDANDDGVAGGELTFSFSTVSLTPLLGTSLSGKVVEAGPDLKPMTFDDIRVGPDQVLHTPDDVFLTPLAGVKVFIVGLESQFVLTDAQGNFSFASAPAGNVKLAIDGRTATNAPTGTFFPEMVMDLNLEAGRANTVMGTMGTREQQVANRDRQEVYLPRLQTSILQNVSGAAPTTITVMPEAAANITPEQRALLTLQVQPGSMRDQNGNLVAAGQVGISTVPAALVREMLPPGLLQHTFDITIQAPGVTNFATPAPMTFPNLFGGKPGEQLSFLSFDHTTGRLVIEGSATVSADGLSVHTDPGTGITHPGWHGLTPPGSPTRPDDDDKDDGLGDLFSYEFTSEVLSDNPRTPSPTVATSIISTDGMELGAVANHSVNFAAATAPRGIGDTLLTGDDERVRFTYKNTTPTNRSRGSVVQVKVTVDPAIAHKYLDGLTTHEYTLGKGDAIKFNFTIKAPPDFLKLDHDVLIGAKFKFEAWEVAKNGTRTVLPETGEYYVYRYVDAMDDSADDGRLFFPATVVDSANPYQRVRVIEYRGDRTAIPELTIQANLGAVPQFTTTQFDALTDPSFALLQFAPTVIQSNSDAVGNHQLQLFTPTTAPRGVSGLSGGSAYNLVMHGDGVDKRQINLNKAGLEKTLATIANGQRAIDITFTFNLAPGQTLSQLPTKFALSYQGRSTPRLPLSTAPIALYVHLRDLLGFFNVDVSVTEESKNIISGALTGGKHITRSYRLEFPDALMYPSDPITVAPAMGGIYSSSVKFDYNNGGAEITPNEISLIDTPEKRDTFATNVLDRVKQIYAGFANTVVVHDALPATTVQHSVDWVTVKRDDAFGIAPSALPLLEKLSGLMAQRRKLNPAQFEFQLAKIVAADPTEPVQVFVDNFFALTYPFYDVPEEVVLRSMAKTTAHELAHSLGMMHNAEKEAIEPKDEQQVVDVNRLGPDDFFRLNFAGEKTEPIRPGATAAEVQAALRALNAFKDKKAVTVLQGAPGLYTVNFVFPKTAANPKPDFHGKDLPALRVIGPGDVELPDDSVVTTVNGGQSLRPLFQILTTNSAGTPESTLTDILASGPVPGEVSIQEKASGAGLKFAARGPWSASDKDAFVSQMLKILLYTAKKKMISGFFDPAIPDEGESAAEIDFYNVEGPYLELLTTNPGGEETFVTDETDFGSASVVSPAVKRFSLVNLGSEPATIRGIGIVKGTGVFSTPTIAARVLAPGESLEFDVTFAPDAALDFEGTLSIDSDLPEFNGEFDLVGDGQPPNKPAIHLSAAFNTLVPFYNNIGGYQVGEQLFRGAGSSPLLTNNGTAPLTITQIRVATGQGEEEYQVTPLAAPRVLAPGESLGIDLRFRPSKVGLRPGAVEVLSNDPRTPVLRIPVVATGVNVTQDSLNQNIYLGADLGNDYIAVTNNLSLNSRSNRDNLPVLRTRSDDAGNWEFFLPAERYALAVTYDPVSGLVAASSGVTNATGVNTFLNRGNFIPSIFPDTDGDGLPDDVEFAIGTNPNKLDSDGDGKNDFAELDGGFNPIDDRPAANGIVSALQTGTTALDIKLAADFLDPSRSIAYIASGSSGLTVVDVTDFARPITIAQLSLPGSANNLSLDVNRKIIAAASPSNGVSLIDVSDPARPTLLRTLAHEGADPVAAVELYDGLAYAAAGNKIRNFDVQSGEPNADFVIAGQRLMGMSRSGDYLYVTARDTTTNQYSLRTVEITATGLVASGAVTVPNVTTLGDPYVTIGFEGRRDIIVQTPVGPVPETVFFKHDLAWIPAGDRIVTVDVSNRPSPEIVSSTYTIAQGGAADIELNGSGLAVVAGVVNPGGSAIVLRTFYLNETNQLFTRYTLPSFGEAIALSSGLAYIADGVSGLQLVNFLQRDTGLVPPTVSLNPIAGDLNPGQLGVQLLEGSTVTIGNQIADDVQVQRVELLADGQVVRTELSYPYDLTTVLPTIAQTGAQVVLQVRATDTGGNVTLSPPQVIDLVADTTAPTVTLLDPPNGSTQTLARRKVTLQFSEAIDPASVIAANFVLQGPGGPVTPISVDLRQRDTRIDILYPPLSEGTYTFTTHAAQVKDRAGNPLGASDIVSTFTIAPATRQPTIRWVNDAGGSWATASNWIDVATNAARVPTTTDDVLIDVPTDALITFGSGVVTVNSILSNERFAQSGGTLTVTDTMQVNNTFTLGINQAFSNNIPTFKGTLLRGSGGQGLTLVGESRLNTATIQTDITTTQANTQLRLTGGLALTGTFTGPTAANTNVQIGLEGSQTISSGTFLSAEAANNAGVIQFMSLVAGNTITFGQDVTLQGQFRVLSGGYYNPPFGVTTTLNVVNYGTMKVGGQPDTSNFGIVLSTTADSFINHGLLESQGAGSLVLNAKSFTNAATGRIKIEQAAGSNQLFESLGAGGTTTSFVNAGSIELINASAQIMSRADGANETWSNTGTIIVDRATLRLYGSFTSDDVVNVRNTGIVHIIGQMDNTGRTFTFNSQTRSYYSGGTIRGGTLVMGGPDARLILGGTLDGVTLRGDMQLGGLQTDPISGISSLSTNGAMRVINGLTLDGVISIPANTNWKIDFVGAQTVSGGTYQFIPRTDGIGGFGASGLQATNGPVVLDSSVTIRAQANGEFFTTGGALSGNFISNASIIMNAYSGISLVGIQHATAPISFVNRGAITAPANSTLSVGRPFANEGQIVVNGGTMIVGDPSNNLLDPFSNTGTINLTGGGRLILRTAKTDGRATFRTAELGTIIDSSGFVQIEDNVKIDNAGATLVIDGTASWSLTAQSDSVAAQIVGGTIQVDSTAKFDIFRAGVLKDVVVNGNLSSAWSANLVGDVDINGVFMVERALTLGHPTLYPGTPLNIRGGEFLLKSSPFFPMTGYSTVSTVTLDPDVVWKAGDLSSFDATFDIPLTNRGRITAEQRFASIGSVVHFTAAPITNEGTLSAVNRAVLRINNLAAPNSGVVAATSGSSVQFTGAFAQSAVGTTHIEIGGEAIGLGGGNFTKRFGEVTVGAAATLAGTLEINFLAGFTPTVGSRYQVLNYASHTGQFDMLNVTGLASGLVVTPEYNGTNLTLVISSAAAVLAQMAVSAIPATSAVEPSAVQAGSFAQWGANNVPARNALAQSPLPRHAAFLAELLVADDAAAPAVANQRPAEAGLDFNLLTDPDETSFTACDEAFDELELELAGSWSGFSIF
jgi:hypothetical protein